MHPIYGAWVHVGNTLYAHLAKVNGAPALFTADYKNELVDEVENAVKWINFWQAQDD